MTRRAALPGADELFRTTSRRSGSGPVESVHVESAPVESTPPASDVPVAEPKKPSSGRRKHDSKITVYVSGEELLSLEQARLVLRGEHGIAVDRGRVVREAVAVLLADLEERGEDSVLVRRLWQERRE